MHDNFDRTIHYLRLSLTGACHMRCTYCRPNYDRNNKSDMMTAAEIELLVRHLVTEHGVTKVRLTGGDPTTRTDLVEIIERLAAIDGLCDLAMTTNGLTLKRMVSRYAQAGLMRVNVSLDSLNRERFTRMTGVDGLRQVIAGIDAALNAGLIPLKINTVVLRGENEAQLPSLVEFAADRGIAIRFIELMPMGPLADQWADRYVTVSEMKSRLDDSVVTGWRAKPRAADSAQTYAAALRNGRCADIGFIAPMSCKFCAACDRLRITSDGSIYPCLMDQPRGSLLPAVRPRLDGTLFDQLLAQALADKALEHPAKGFTTMTTIGG